MLREPTEPPTAEPKQSGSFRYLQGMLEAGEGGKTPAALPHLPSHFSGEGGWRKPHLGDPTPFLPAIHPFRVSASRPHTPSCALPTTAPGPKLSKPTLQASGGPRSRSQPHTHKSEVFPFFDLHLLALGSCRPHFGFQGSGLGLAARGTSNPPPASWAPR